jgi:hypothetical protein
MNEKQTTSFFHKRSFEKKIEAKKSVIIESYGKQEVAP